MIRILVGGDVCPIRRAEEPMAAGNARAVFGDLLDEFRVADLSVVNLECPLIKAPSPARKVGPVLGAPIECARGLLDAGIGVVGLANNHILDHTSSGLVSTLSACRRHGVATVGAGPNLTEASRILIRSIGGVRVAVMAMAEREFSTATDTSPGANPIDLIRFVRAMKSQRDSYDWLLVLLHAGNEFYPYPSPRLRALCHFLIEEGAGAVVCQHSHCPGSLERYRAAHIVYGQGNLVFDMHPRSHECWHDGFLASFELDDDLHSNLHLVPFRQFDEVASARKLNGAALGALRASIEKRSRDLLDETLLSRCWQGFCEANADQYLSHLSGHSRLLRYLNRKVPFASRLYSEKRRRLVRSMIQCESHRDALETILEAH